MSANPEAPRHLRPIRPSDGQALRDEGMARAEYGGAHVLGVRADWNTRVDRHFRWWALTQDGEWTMDDYRAFPGVVEPPSPQMWGAAVKRWIKAGLITPVGFTDSTNPSRHAGITRLYRTVG
jgi:hypothetical protein